MGGWKTDLLSHAALRRGLERAILHSLANAKAHEPSGLVARKKVLDGVTVVG